jgi:hypothetical protein
MLADELARFPFKSAHHSLRTATIGAIEKSSSFQSKPLHPPPAPAASAKTLSLF